MRALKLPKAFEHLREDFPILKQMNRNRPLIYLDSASSAQKPQQVIEAIGNFYAHDYANIHRGIYELSARATHLYENTRIQAQQFLGAQQANEIIFVKGTTEGINLIAQTFGQSHLCAGDEIILSEMEHHSNIVPWYLLREQLGIILKIIPLNDDGSLDLTSYQQLFSDRTKLVAITHVSNTLGTINPIKEMTALAHKHQVPVLVDGAQAVPHMPVNVTELDCDFYVFSAHKLYGPTGVGVLYVKNSLLSTLPPYQGGGGMIETVAFDHITFTKPPQLFEAGTPDIAGVIGLSAALQYVTDIGMQSIYEHEQALLQSAEEKLSSIPGLRIIGTAKPKVGVISFVIENIHPHDIGTVLDYEGIAVRAGHHCTMPIMKRFQVPATIRASFGLYNNFNEVEALVSALYTAKRMFN